MKLLLSIVYVILPEALYLSLRGIYNFDVRVLDFHVYISQAGICVALLFKLRTHKYSRSMWLLFMAFSSVLLADVVYAFTIHTPSREWLGTVYVGELSYTVFMTSLLAYLAVKLKPSINDWMSTIVLLIAAIVFALLSFVYILIPYYHINPAPPTFYLVNSTIYSLIQATIVGITIPSILRSNDQYEHIFLQSVLLLSIADFAIRYHSGFENVTLATWHSLIWAVSMAIFFMVILQRELTFDQGHFVRRYISACRETMFLMCSPFDKLRANGMFSTGYPFVLSLSKHKLGVSRQVLY